MSLPGLITTLDLAVYLDTSESDNSARLSAAIGDASSLIRGYLRSSLTAAFPVGAWQWDTIAAVTKRVAARLYDNPLDADSVQVQSGSGSWSASASPRTLTGDEREQLDGLGVRTRVGSSSTSGLTRNPYAIEDAARIRAIVAGMEPCQ